MIRTRYACLQMTDEGCVSHFADGSSYGSHPHPEMPHYQHLAFRMGLMGDTLAFCREHELAHHVIAEEFDEPSSVLWALAHGLVPDRFAAAAEEALAMALQRYARCNEPPLIDRIDWPRIKARFLSLAEKVR